MTVSLPTMYDAKPIFLYIILFFPGIINVTSEVADKALSVRAIGDEVATNDEVCSAWRSFVVLVSPSDLRNQPEAAHRTRKTRRITRARVRLPDSEVKHRSANKRSQ